jgi:hypothetical protein
MRIDHRTMEWLVHVIILIGSRVECATLDQEETMTRSSKLSVRRRCANAHKMQSKVGRLVHAYYSSLLEQSVPGELRRLVVQLLAVETRKHHSTEQAMEVLQLAAAPIERNSNPTDRLP